MEDSHGVKSGKDLTSMKSETMVDLLSWLLITSPQLRLYTHSMKERHGTQWKYQTDQ